MTEIRLFGWLKIKGVSIIECRIIPCLCKLWKVDARGDTLFFEINNGSIKNYEVGARWCRLFPLYFSLSINKVAGEIVPRILHTEIALKEEHLKIPSLDVVDSSHTFHYLFKINCSGKIE